jgi:hypothetical protein
MSYGLKVEGTDSGGTFIVTDTDKNLRNLRVVDHGTFDTQITLDSPLQSNDLLFVKNPQEPTAGWETFTRTRWDPETGQNLTLLWEAPTYHYITLSSDEKTVYFKGGRIGSIGGSNRGFVSWYAYQGWDVAFDWFLVRDVGQIVSDGLSSNETHGLQILTEEVNGVQDIAFDSRAVINDKTFSINGVAPSNGSWSYSNIRTQFTYGESGSYVNIEHTAVGASVYDNGGYDGGLGGLRIRGLQVGVLGAYVYEGLLEFEEGGQGILWFPNNVALFSAKMYTGAPSGTGATDGSGTDTSGSDGTDESNSGVTETAVVGTIELATGQDNKITEGTDPSITYNVGVNNSGDYNLKVIRNSGSVGGGELNGTQKTFSGTSTSITITAANDSTSEIGWQGENFTLELRTGSTIGSGTLVQSSSFSLYDDDLSVTVLGTSGTRVDIPNSATNAYVYASFSSAGDTAVAGRIKDSSGTVIRSGFNFNYSGNTTILVTTGLPGGIGSTSTTTESYTLEAYSGNAWLSTPFTIRRLADDSSSSGVAQSNPTLSGSSSMTIESTEVSVNIFYSGMQSGEQIRMVDETGAVSSSATTAFGGTVTVTINSNLPAAGASETFTPQVKATGGDWTPKTGGNITITRQSSGGGFNPDTGGGDFSST